MVDEQKMPLYEVTPSISEDGEDLKPGDLIPALISIVVCSWCSSEEIKLCQKCNKPFCTLHCSRWSPMFCQECFGSNGRLKLIQDKFTKSVKDYDVVNETLVTRKTECDRLRMDGEDWVWFTKWINQLSDEDLEIVFEFHYFVIRQIELANETRKINRRDKLVGRKVKLSSGITTTTETKTKKVKTQVDMGTMLRKQFPNLAQSIIDTMVEAAKKAANGE